MIYDYKDPHLWEELVPAIEQGEIFVYPTDTIYGLGVRADSADALNRLYVLKRRPANMPLSILVPDIGSIRRYASFGEKAESIARHFLPGALTMVLPAAAKYLPEMLYSGKKELGFRIPAHPFCQSMMQRIDYPIVSSSVNYSGQPALTAMSDIEQSFASEIRLMIRDNALEKRNHATASTVIRIDKDDKVWLLREGGIPFLEILEVSGG